MVPLAALLLLAVVRAPRPSWSTPLSLDGVPLTLRISNESWVGTALEVRRGTEVLASAQDDLYPDLETRPHVWVEGEEAILAFAANPDSGSGPYATLWRIGSRGRRLRPIGRFFHADLREWSRRGIVREIRPTKYATDDILRRFPKAFDEARYIEAKFVVAYRYDRKARRLRLLGVRLASAAEARAWPDTVRFPFK